MSGKTIAISVEEQTIEGNTHQTLLQQLEGSGYQVDFQCRDGMCGSCRCQLLSGRVMPGLALAALKQGEILACNSVPRSDLTLRFAYPLVKKA